MTKPVEVDLQAEIDRLKNTIEYLKITEIANAKAPSKPPCRAKLPADRKSYTFKFKLYDSSDPTKSPKLIKGWCVVGCYENGSPGEIFIYFDRPGSKLRGFSEIGAVFASMLLQAGVPLEKIAEKGLRTRFQPAGMTGDPKQPFCTSLFDYIFGYMLRKHGSKEAAKT